MSGVSKVTADRSQRILMELVAKPGNDSCADCKCRAPRWASHNLGIFLCVRCASIHRKIGTHVTKVKSLTLDSWNKEQVENMKTIGNVKSNQRWNPDERRNPPPTNMEQSERDSELEKYIRSKYEYKRFIDRSIEASAQLGPSQAKQAAPARPQTAPIPDSYSGPSTSRPSRSPAPPLPTQISNTEYTQAAQSTPYPGLHSSNAGLSPSTAASTFSGSQVHPPPRMSSNPQALSRNAYQTPAPPRTSPFLPTQSQPQNRPKPLSSPLWDDLASLQAPSTNTSLPLQYQSPTTFSQGQPSPFSPPHSLPMSIPNSATNPYANLSATGGLSPGPAFPSSFSGMDRSPNTRSASLPAFGSAPSPGIAPNPFQQQYAPATAPMPVSPASAAPNPFQQFTGMGAGAQPQLQAFAQQPFGAQARQQPFVPHPFPQSHSPSPFSAGGFPQQQQQQQQQAQPNTYTTSPFTQHAQQAQQLFQSMASGTNPFEGQAWGR